MHFEAQKAMDCSLVQFRVCSIEQQEPFLQKSTKTTRVLIFSFFKSCIFDWSSIMTFFPQSVLEALIIWKGSPAQSRTEEAASDV